MVRLRLIYESHTTEGRNPVISKLKIFVYVPGAVIKVSIASGMKVGAMLKMVSNQGRMFPMKVVPIDITFILRA
jgi:hypothetical protein